MILTIKAADSKSYKTAIWEASQMMGLDVEQHADNTFDVIVFDQVKLDRILDKARGKVISSKHSQSLY